MTEYEIITTDNIEQILEKSTVFERIGISKVESKILAILFLTNKPQSARNIEKWMDMRQPEVSGGTKSLQARNWIRETYSKIEQERGRPQKAYELTMAREMLFEEIKQGLYNQFKNNKDLLNELKEEKKEEFETICIGEGEEQ